MFDYLLSYNVLIVFLAALVFTFLFDKKHPFLCYLVWIVFLIKLFIPWGAYEISFVNPLSRIGFTEMSMLPDLSTSGSFPQAPHAGYSNPGTRLWMNDPANTINPQNSHDVTTYPYLNDTVSFKPFYLYKMGLFWLLLSFLVLLREIYCLCRTINIIKRGTYLKQGSLYRDMIFCAKQLSLSTIPQLVSSKQVLVPFSFGLTNWQYVIVPESYKNKPSEETQIILCHELAHLQKKDSLINIFRVLGLIFFHIHPLRIVADFFLYRYQEITSDIQSLHALRIKPERYLQVLIKEFVYVNKDTLLHSFSSSLSLGHLSFFQRLRYIKDYTPQQKTVTLVFCFLCLGMVLIVMPSNFSFSQSDYSQSDLILAGDTTSGFQAKPWFETEALSTEAEAYPLLLQDYLLIVEPYIGVKFYRVGVNQPPTIVTRFLLQEHSTTAAFEKIRDVELYDDYIYIAIGNRNGISFAYSRIDIFQWAEDRSIKKVGQLEQNHPRMLQVVDHSLWVAGSGDDIIEGAIWRYDLSQPQNPQVLETAYMPVFPTSLEFHPSTHSVFVIAYDAVYIYDSDKGLTSSDFFRPLYQPIQLEIFDDHSLIVHGIKQTSLGGQESYLQLYQWQDTNEYRLVSVQRLLFPDGILAPIPLDMLALEDRLLLTFNDSSMALLQKEETQFNLKLYQQRAYQLSVHNDRLLFFLGPKSVLFTITEFIENQTFISSWMDYEYHSSFSQG